MRVTRQTATELIVEDSSLWIAWVCAIASLPLFYAGASTGKKGSFVGAGFFLLCALIAARKSRFVFDAGHRIVRWTNRVAFKTSTGAMPFDDIRGIGIETLQGSGGGLTYRLTILTPQKPVPLSSAYGSGSENYSAIRKTIATFLNLETGSPDHPTALDPSVLALVRAGRKIDAITLLRSTKTLSLVDAKRIVDELESGQKAKP